MTDVVEAARFDNRVEADLARTYLESYGLHAVLFDADINTVYGGPYAPFFPVRLMVLDEDLPEARKVLELYAKEDERSARGRTPRH